MTKTTRTRVSPTVSVTRSARAAPRVPEKEKTIAMTTHTQELLRLVDAYGYQIETISIRYGGDMYFMHATAASIYVTHCTTKPDGEVVAEIITTVRDPETAHQAIVAHAAEREMDRADKTRAELSEVV